MRPALSEQIKNETEAVYFINAVFALDWQLYEKCVAKLKDYKEYFPQANDLRSNGIHQPGELIIRKVFLSKTGYDNAARRVVLKRIKDVFKRCYYENAGFEPLPAKVMGVLEFKRAYLKIFEQQVVCLKAGEKPVLAQYLFHSISSTTEALWIKTAGAATAGALKAALAGCLPQTAGLSSEEPLETYYKQLFTNGAAIYVIESCPFLEIKQNRELIAALFTAVTANIYGQLVLLECGGEAEEAQLPARKQKMHITGAPEPGIKKWQIAAAAVMVIFIFVTVLLVANRFFNSSRAGTLQLKYFGDEVQQDNYYGGLLLTFVDSRGKVVSNSYTRYEAVSSPGKIPPGAAQLILTKGNYEVYPDTLPVTDLKQDTITIVFYRTMRMPDVATDTIWGSNSQRWYTFTLADTEHIAFTCEALSDSFSPQIAVFADRLGKNRVLSCANTDGSLKSVQIGGVLPAGKYYLKTRGYDNLRGVFKITGSLLPR